MLSTALFLDMVFSSFYHLGTSLQHSNTPSEQQKSVSYRQETYDFNELYKYETLN